MTGADTSPPPEAELIKRWRTNPPHGGQPLSLDQAVECLAAVTDKPFTRSTWYAIEHGRHTSDQARYDRQLAAMCLVLSIPPDELAATGRTEAAGILREQLRRRQLAEQAMARVELATSDIRAWLQHAVQQILDGPFPEEDKPGMIDDLIEAARRRLTADPPHRQTG